ncbi:putative Casein kinase I [Fusarium oxysporum f. sp. albedinis]|nr:putative Casein kinase I [Fusarium oxysporum f. sp. albedinis]
MAAEEFNTTSTWHGEHSRSLLFPSAFIATVSLITHPMEENIISKPKSHWIREGNVDHGFNFASVDKQIKRADKIYAHEVSHYRRSQEDNAVMCQNHHSPAVDTLGLRMY